MLRLEPITRIFSGQDKLHDRRRDFLRRGHRIYGFRRRGISRDARKTLGRGRFAPSGDKAPATAFTARPPSRAAVAMDVIGFRAPYTARLNGPLAFRSSRVRSIVPFPSLARAAVSIAAPTSAAGGATLPAPRRTEPIFELVEAIFPSPGALANKPDAAAAPSPATSTVFTASPARFCLASLIARPPMELMQAHSPGPAVQQQERLQPEP